MNRDNQTWVQQLTLRQESAVAELRRALLRNLRVALVNRSGVDDAFLEDAVQDAVLRVIDRLDQFAGRSQFLTWATSIAIRIGLGELRRSRWKDVSLSDIVADSAAFSEQAMDSPRVTFDHQSVLTALRDSIRHDLTERQRIALTAELKGMPLDEIALQLGSNRNAVYKLTHDARKKLKARLEADGYGIEDVGAATH